MTALPQIPTIIPIASAAIPSPMLQQRVEGQGIDFLSLLSLLPVINPVQEDTAAPDTASDEEMPQEMPQAMPGSETGNILPDGLPVLAATVAGGATPLPTEMAGPVTPASLRAEPGPPSLPVTTESAPRPDAPPAGHTPLRPMVLTHNETVLTHSEYAQPGPAMSAEPARHASLQQASGAVTLSLSHTPAGRTGERGGGREATPDAPLPRPASTLAKAPAAPTDQPPAPAPPGAPAASPAQPAPMIDHVAAPAITPARHGTHQTTSTQDIARIVETLSSARDALTPRSAAMAIDHAAYGTLHLRFDRHQDGAINVQLAASEPEAHRALAAAMAERPGLAQQDSTGGNQAGAQQQAGSQHGSKGHFAERHGDAPHGHPARQQRGGDNLPRRASTDEQRGQAGNPDGIFA